jgi:hypothetical protein
LPPRPSRADRLRLRLDRPRTPAARRRYRPPRATPGRRDHRRRTTARARRPRPARGIAQLAARWAAACMLDPAGVTRTKALRSERMMRKLHDALPGEGHHDAGRHLGVHATDALAGSRRAQPRRLHRRRQHRDDRRPRCPIVRRPTSKSSPSTTSQTPTQRRTRCRLTFSRPVQVPGGRTVLCRRTRSTPFFSAPLHVPWVR